MSSQFSHVLTTTIQCDPEHRPQVLAILAETAGSKSVTERLYTRVDSCSEILLTSYASAAASLMDQLASADQQERERRLTPFLASDYRRQLLGLVEVASSRDKPLIDSDFLQLRYIEVPRRVHADYLAWREQTIFPHVRAQQAIESFYAYHTSLSTQPGVLFFSGFSCSPADYRVCFENPIYHDIVREAGDRFIAGGTSGLYTRIYQRV